MTQPNPPPPPPTQQDNDPRPVKSGKATDGKTPDDSAPPQDPDDDGSEP
jgi:hypothetical protein